jgi:hypothetical protein
VWFTDAYAAQRVRCHVPTEVTFQTQNRHFMSIKHNIRPLYALLSASL